MNIPYWLLKLLPMWDYICPRCRRDVSKNSHKCPYCGERFPFPVRVPPKVLKDTKALEEYVHKHVFPKVSAWQRDYLVQFFTVIFQDGFESGDFSAWTGTTVSSGQTLEVQTVIKFLGIYALHARTTDATNAYAYKSFTTSSTQVNVRAYVYFDNLPSVQYGYYFLRLFNTGGTDVWSLRFRETQAIELLRRFPSYGVVGSYPVNLDQWYCVEVQFIKSSTAGEYRLYVNGTQVLSQTGLDTSGAGDLGTIRFGSITCYNNIGTIDFYGDCVVVADTYIGPEGALITKTWAASLNTIHVLGRPVRSMKLTQNLNTSHVFSRPFRSFRLTQTLNSAHVFIRNRFMRLTQALQTLHTWTVTYPGLILKQWFATLQTTHTFRRPFRQIKLGQSLQTIHTFAFKRLFKLTQALSLIHVLRRPYRRLGYTQQLQPTHVFSRPVRLIKLPATLQLTHVFKRPYRFMRLLEQLSLGHAYFVAVPGVKKTRLFLVIGDLAIQLSGD